MVCILDDNCRPQGTWGSRTSAVVSRELLFELHTLRSLSSVVPTTLRAQEGLTLDSFPCAAPTSQDLTLYFVFGGLLISNQFSVSSFTPASFAQKPEMGPDGSEKSLHVFLPSCVAPLTTP